MKRLRPIVAFALVIALAGCSVTAGNARPEESKLADGIKLLITDFTARHPDLINWEPKLVSAQLKLKLPKGVATEAGWTLVWPGATTGELSRVVIPWSILAQYPDKFALDTNNYSGGNAVPDAISVDIRSAQQKGDPYFAAIVHLRTSTHDSHWLIFTSIPYLPITDNAYGWAHLVDGKWKIVDFGTATVGCGSVPKAIQSEFGFSCPPGN